MKSWDEWKTEQLTVEEAAPLLMRRLMGPSSALGSGQQHADPSVRMKINVILPLIKKKFPDTEEALKQIILAATAELEDLGTTFSPRQALRAYEDKPEVATKTLPDDDEDIE